jgi:uncharacterized protein YjiS (DUF1127 family)
MSISASNLSLAPAALPTPSRFAQFRQTVSLWIQRIQERAELAQCDDRDLQDMGVSRATALAEIRKPFWRE